MCLKILIILAAFSYTYCSAAADPSALAGKSGGTDVARPAAQEINIDLVVRDKKGRPFRKLRPADLEIKDDGTPVNVKDLRLVSAPVQSPTEPGREARAQTIALVFDSAMTERRRVRKVAGEIVRQAGPGTWFAVFYAGRQFAIVQPYTQDRAVVRAAIEKATFLPARRAPRGAAASAGGSRQATFSMPPDDTQAGRLARISFDSSVEAGKLSAEENTNSPVIGLLALARSHARFQGSKAVALFSEWLQLTTRLRVLMRDTIATANRANLAVFVFDTTEISVAAHRNATAQFSGPASVGVGGMKGVGAASATWISQQPYNVELNAGPDAQGPLRELAKGTGGFYQENVIDSVKPVRRLLDSVETHYEAGFVSAASDYDGRYRPVTVALKNHSLRLQAQGGYVALPPGATADTRPFEIPLLKMLAAEALPEALSFRSRVLNMGRSQALVVEIPLRDLSGLEDASSRLFNLHFSVLARVRAASGEVLRTFGQEVPYRVALERRQQAQAGVYTFYRRLSLPAGNYTLECAVLDQNSQRAGAGRSALRVEPVADGPLVSDISLVREVEPLPGEIPADGDYFRYKNSKVVPALETSYSALAGAPLRFFLTVEGSKGGRPALEIRLSRDGVTVTESPLQPAANWAGAPIPLLFSVPAEGLFSGNYQIRVRASEDGRTREKTADIQVEGIAAPAVQASGPRLAALRPVGEMQAAPGADELKRILAGIEQRALEYTERLPNFGCLVSTRRWVDPTGLEQWRPKDNYVELVRIIDNDEEHKLVEVNGKVPSIPPGGMRSSGEFGGLLKMALDPVYHPQVQWKEQTLLGNRLVHVLSYQVERGYSALSLHGDIFPPGVTQPAYHGLLYVEPETLNVRRLTLEADIPVAKSGSHQVSINVDYDYVALGQRDYVLPIQAELRVKTARGALIMNQLEFRDYRRFSAQSAIRFEQP